MASFGERVLDDRQHPIVALRVKNVTRADENLDLIGLRPRLIEPLGQIVEIERDKINDTLPRDPDSLPFLDLESRAGILWHNLTLQDSQSNLLKTHACQAT